MVSQFFDPIGLFLLDQWPERGAWFRELPLLMALAALQLVLCAWCRQRWISRTGLTRKLFHFMVFTTAAVLVQGFGPGLLCLYGGATTLVLILFLFFLPPHWGRVALERESDAPDGLLFVVLPWLATFMGGVVINAHFPTTAACGMLVVGLGDAIAEPVGLTMGRHPYRLTWVPWLRKATRSLEGSGAIAIVCTGVFLWGTDLSAEVCLMLGFSMALVECFSPHGWDNLSLQLAGAIGPVVVGGA